MNYYKYKKTEWDPCRSKWKAALKNGFPIKLKGNENILYLGASSGTTVSHLSKKTSGIIFAVEKATTMAIPLIKLSTKLENVAPLFCDAQDTTYIKNHLFEISPDILFQDIPSLDQVEILEKASQLVDKNCKIYLSLKTQSISQRDPEKTILEAKAKLEKNFIIENSGTLEPFHKKHYFLILKKKY